MKWVGLAARVGLAVVWLYAASSKVVDLPGMVRAVRNYEILPEWAAVVVGHTLPFVELGLGILLLLGLFTRFSAVVSAALLVVFIVGIGQAWARGLTIDCGCFGGGGQVAAEDTQYPQRIAEDIGFLAMAAWLIWRPRTKFSLDQGLGLLAPEYDDAPFDDDLDVPAPRAEATSTDGDADVVDQAETENEPAPTTDPTRGRTPANATITNRTRSHDDEEN